MGNDLIFPQSHEPKGFSTDATARRDGSPEPIVRELLQNSLDAAKEASKATPERPAEVVFTITGCPWQLIPGAEAYRRAFESARQERVRRQGSGLSADERQVISRIERVVNQSMVPLLICQDNGVGMSDMERVLFEGNTSKPRRGGGSVGVGHMSAFAAPDLRYVLYAGRTSTSDIAGGHAILAAHLEGNTLYSADGYYTKGQDLLSYHPESSKYHADIPEMLQQHIDQLEDTGSVVCITGFNNFREEEDAVHAICRVAAINFLAAISHEEFIVKVCRDGVEEQQVDKDTIEEILRQSSEQQRAREGWLAGNRAFRSYETLANGKRLDIEGLGQNEVEVWFRSLSGSARAGTQVNLFRDGMWVALNPTRLNVAAFSQSKPFDCVVLLHSGKLYDLVRESEGPEHRQIEQARLERADRNDLFM